jgi:hypothetical protein
MVAGATAERINQRVDRIHLKYLDLGGESQNIANVGTNLKQMSNYMPELRGRLTSSCSPDISGQQRSITSSIQGENFQLSSSYSPLNKDKVLIASNEDSPL